MFSRRPGIKFVPGVKNGLKAAATAFIPSAEIVFLFVINASC